MNIRRAHSPHFIYDYMLYKIIRTIALALQPFVARMGRSWYGEQQLFYCAQPHTHQPPHHLLPLVRYACSFLCCRYGQDCLYPSDPCLWQRRHGFCKLCVVPQGVCNVWERCISVPNVEDKKHCKELKPNRTLTRVESLSLLAHTLCNYIRLTFHNSKYLRGTLAKQWLI